MVIETGFYEGEQDGFVGWITTKAGTYFIDKDGILSELYPYELSRMLDIVREYDI